MLISIQPHYVKKQDFFTCLTEDRDQKMLSEQHIYVSQETQANICTPSCNSALNSKQKHTNPLTNKKLQLIKKRSKNSCELQPEYLKRFSLNQIQKGMIQSLQAWKIEPSIFLHENIPSLATLTQLICYHHLQTHTKMHMLASPSWTKMMII